MSRRTGLIVFFITAFAGIVIMAAATAFRSKRPPLEADAQADYILIEKKAHKLTLFWQHRRLRSYRIALGRGGNGPKLKAGDAKTPEGLYRIAQHIEKSHFHRALTINYPSEKDVAMARRRGEKAGGDIEIHGMLNGLGWIGPWHRVADWTGGCIAVSDEEIDEIFRAVPDDTPVEIRG
jgi:murein L,D-transpeptidase YafK